MIDWQIKLLQLRKKYNTLGKAHKVLKLSITLDTLQVWARYGTRAMKYEDGIKILEALAGEEV